MTMRNKEWLWSGLRAACLLLFFPALPIGFALTAAFTLGVLKASFDLRVTSDQIVLASRIVAFASALFLFWLDTRSSRFGRLKRQATMWLRALIDRK
jgi:hypothetical protein